MMGQRMFLCPITVFQKGFQLIKYQRHFPRIILFVVLAATYMTTLAPGLSWANDGVDGGDLITAAATGGIPHPTGYPLYILLARFFQFLPLGSLAFRTNLMSAIATVFAALLVYEIAIRAAREHNGVPTWPGALAAGFAFGLSPLVWSQAVITEVYALQGLLVALIIYAYIKPGAASLPKQKLLDGWRGFLLGLATANHITTLFLMPVALLLGSLQRAKAKDDALHASIPYLRRIGWNWAALGRQLTFFGVGLSVYLIIPLRAIANPPINWGNPITLKNFWWLVSGQLYQAYYLSGNLIGLWERLRALTMLFLDQFGLVGLLFGFIGLVVFGKTSRIYVFTIWIVLVSTIFAMLYRSPDSYVYMIPAIIAFSIWVGSGISGMAHEYLKNFSGLVVGLGLVMTIYFIGRITLNYHLVDASMDIRAEDFAQEVLIATPKDAMIFAKGDKAIFTFWYFHFALGERPDLVVMATDLLSFDWYQDNLRSTYPDLNLTSPLPIPETVEADNPTRPACFVEFENKVKIECLSQPKIP